MKQWIVAAELGADGPMGGKCDEYKTKEDI